MGDNIKNLPIDTSEPTLNELQILNSIFGDTKKKLDNKKIILLFLLFIILSVPQVDEILRKFIINDYIIIFIKGIIFVTLYLVLFRQT